MLCNFFHHGCCAMPESGCCSGTWTMWMEISTQGGYAVLCYWRWHCSRRQPRLTVAKGGAFFTRSLWEQLSPARSLTTRWPSWRASLGFTSLKRLPLSLFSCPSRSSFLQSFRHQAIRQTSTSPSLKVKCMMILMSAECEMVDYWLGSPQS